MMICPQTKAECPYESNCDRQCFREFVSGKVINDNAYAGTRKDAMMAEIERLVDAFSEITRYARIAHPHHYAKAKEDEAAARAALIAAYQRLGVK